MRMYFAGDTDKIVTRVSKLILDGMTRDAVKALKAIKAGAVQVPDEQIVAGFASYPMDPIDQIQVLRNNLHVRRVELGLSADDVAERTGLSRSAVYASENDKYNYAMNIATLVQLCCCYNIDVQDAFNPYYSVEH